MAHCPNCGSQLEASAKFCTSCGSKVEDAVVSSSQFVSADFDSSASSVQSASVPASNSFLQGWRTDVGMTIVGIVGSMLFSGLVSAIGGFAGSYFLAFILQLAYSAVALVYVAGYYPSFFGSEPKLNDAKLVSALNGFFGGIVFGCLWNASLTNRKKGVSYIVWIVLAAFSVLGFMTAFFG